MDILIKIKELLKKSLSSSDEAYLYGSRARGTAREDSDWDVLIVVDKDRLEDDDYDRITFPLSYLGWESEQTISPIMYTKREWQKQRITPFYKNVLSEGISLI